MFGRMMPRFVVQVPDGRILARVSCRKINIIIESFTHSWQDTVEVRFFSEFSDLFQINAIDENPKVTQIGELKNGQIAYLVKLKEMFGVRDPIVGTAITSTLLVPFKTLRRIYNIPQSTGTPILSESNKEVIGMLDTNINLLNM